jgi:bis(5'-nucleosyl)-tetraphosphatase (symmetrical)
VRWIVGDVQGCAREFDDLLEWVGLDPARDELWCLGDLVNRGPDSLAVLRLWRDVGGRSLLGNHDIYMLLAHSRRVPRKRGDTLEALYRSEDAPELLGRLRAEPVLQQLAESDRVKPLWIVHAGLDPRWRKLEPVAERLNAAAHDDDWMTQEDVVFATSVRCCTPDGRRCRHTGPPRECPPPFRPWDAFYGGPTLVVHGHWAQRGAYRSRHTMGLDSGCVYGGALTAWCPEEDRIVQVPARERGGTVSDFPAHRL